jgi:hypothetical protein
MDENHEIADAALGYIYRVDVSSVTAVAEVDSASVLQVAHPDYGGIMYLQNVGNTSIPCKDSTAELSRSDSLKSVIISVKTSAFLVRYIFHILRQGS